MEWSLQNTWQPYTVTKVNNDTIYKQQLTAEKPFSFPKIKTATTAQHKTKTTNDHDVASSRWLEIWEVDMKKEWSPNSHFILAVHTERVNVLTCTEKKYYSSHKQHHTCTEHSNHHPFQHCMFTEKKTGFTDICKTWASSLGSLPSDDEVMSCKGLR